MDQTFKKENPQSIEAIRKATLHATLRRIRSCLMTSAATLLALIPVLTSTRCGVDVMVPMAIPLFGGMFLVLISGFIAPLLYCVREELKLRRDCESK